MYEDTLNYLKEEPRFRERMAKDRGIVNLLIKRYPSLETIDKKILVDMVKDYNSMDRYWRMILAERKDLRGTDYDTKEKVSQEYQIGLGYEGGYHQDMLKLKNI